MTTLAIILFITTYILLLSFPKYRPYISLTSAFVFTILFLTVNQAIAAIEWNVIMIIAGTMGVVSLFIDSKMPALLADKIIEKTPNVKWAIIALCLFTSLISAFIDNVATVLMVAPIAINISRKLKTSPILSIIAISISSNLQGVSTLVGDTTSIVLAEHAGLDFLDFFVLRYSYQSVEFTKIGIFWVVQIACLMATAVLYFIFRKENQTFTIDQRTKVKDYFPTVLLLGIIVLLIFASSFPNKPAITNGVICMSLFVIGLIVYFIRFKTFKVIRKPLSEIDYFTLLLLIGLFIIIEGLTKAGVIDVISDFIFNVSGGNVFIAFTVIVFASVLFSAFIDNIPYVITMLPVMGLLSTQLDIDPMLMYFGLMIGATLGGNLTPIGASANIAAIGILRKEGYVVSVPQFMKVGVPVTIVAVLTGYALVWIIFGI